MFIRIVTIKCPNERAKKAYAVIQTSERRFYSGFAIPRLLSNKEYNLEPHYYFITGGLIKISEALMLKPSFLLKQTKGCQERHFSY